MRTVIIGGGIGGLAAALCLGRAGLETVVCEQAQQYRNVGLSFILQPNGLAALDALGLGDAARQRGQLLNRVVLRLTDGTVIKDTPLDESLCITRYDLIDILYQALPASHVLMGRRFSHFQRAVDGTATAACFEDGSVEAGDLFIGTDGVRSLVRTALFPQHQLSPVRICELVCFADAPDLALEVGPALLKTYHPDGGLALGMAPSGQGRLVWYLQFDPKRFAMPGEHVDERRVFVERLVRDWPAPIPTLLEATDLTCGHVWHTTDLEPLPSYSDHNVVLLGDAAHAFLTFTSQGVNSALQDAITLAEDLAGCADVAAIPAAFARFETERRAALCEYLVAGRKLADHFLHPLTADAFDLPLVK